MGLKGFEPLTLRLSSACSNQLSYRPGVAPAAPKEGNSGWTFLIGQMNRLLPGDASDASKRAGLSLRHTSSRAGKGALVIATFPEGLLAEDYRNMESERPPGCSAMRRTEHATARAFPDLIDYGETSAFDAIVCPKAPNQIATALFPSAAKSVGESLIKRPPAIGRAGAQRVVTVRAEL